MTLTTRMMVTLALIVATAVAAVAQDSAEAPATQAAASKEAAGEAAGAAAEGAAAVVDEGPSIQEVRNRFYHLITEYPPELATILALDPTLLSNESFLAAYPQLAKFLDKNPEVRRNPRFYLSMFGDPSDNGVAAHLIEMLSIASVFLLFTFAGGWLLRTLIEQKRWSRLSQTQTEVHNKILDRFSNSSELLDYIKTPAGTKFLESAPIPLHAERAPQNVQLTRVIWSVQIGIVVMAGAIGMLLVSGRFEKESAQALFAMGMIGVCVGAGFIASGAISIYLSRRLGLWSSAAAPELDESGLVR